MESKIPIWLDCDPGQDDTVAIILACFHPNFKLIGISTSHGNVSLKNTTSNALRVLTALGRTDIPVFPGASHPIGHSTFAYASEVHGETGLNGSRLLPQARMEAQKGSAFYQHLANIIKEYKGDLSIVATGPLTNMCLFFKNYPELRSQIKWLPIMGGGFKSFNKNNNAEFNFFCDPLAANSIMTDKILSNKIILASLDITSKVFFPEERQMQVLGSDSVDTASNFRALMFELIDSFHKRMVSLRGSDYPGPKIHDPVALVALLQFENISQELNFSVDRRSFKVGTSKDLSGAIMECTELENEGIYVLTDLNVNKFWELVLDVYAIADQKCFINKIPRSLLLENSS
ncbi:trifunctional uridine nucleosidase/nicotinamide riboside hydrolase/nicotinic acid riboside hydrolase [Martiniozyma asiatica (nom. inval.)]|nr:trifunctional uridine nucleosidase/nicotinamide riboside hydrolase/nicotinic acid riboside hydrolase [Martiniozyma asiatica]